MAESRFQRWSRRKSELRTETESEQQVAVPEAEPELSPEEQELAENEALPESEVLEKYNLPNPDSIELGTDITGFMKKEIPEALRRKALRSLWRSNPVLAVLDGLNDYDEDFTDAATAGQVVKTIYKVGQGMIEKSKKFPESVPATEPASATEVPVVDLPDSDVIAESELQTVSEEQVDDQQAALTETRVETQRLGVNTVSVSEEAQRVEAESEPIPRFRPRMRFE